MQKIKVAVTGGIGSGKSAAMRCIQDMGYPAFSCDEIYKEIMCSPKYVEEIKKVFPEAVINGAIDRNILGKIVFDDKNKREILNKIAHPLIMQSLIAYMDNCENELVFAEVPLLLEGNYEKQFDRVIVIKRDQEKRILSVQERDGICKEEIKKRINAQFDYNSKEGVERLKKCRAYIIENEGTLEDLKTKLKNLIVRF